jgi:hypothetical protein
VAGYRYFDEQDDSDQALIYSSRLPGIAEAAGLKPASANEELVIDTFLTSLGYAGESEKALSYSRRSAHYSRRSRYRKPAFTFTNAVRSAAKVVGAGLAVENRTKPGHRGWQSTLMPTPGFMSLWSQLTAQSEPPFDIKAETIILRSRGDDRKPLEYADGPKTSKMRTALGPVNEMLRSLRLDVPDAINIRKGVLMFEAMHLDRFDRPVVKRQHVRVSNMAGRRIFADDFKHHGRFYCAPQNIPSGARRNMLINGEPCVELDYSAMHPTLAYSVAGIRMDRDPYEVGNAYSAGEPGRTRKHIKLGLLIVLNARDPDSAVRALARHGREIGITHVKAKAIVNAIFDRHDAIRGMLCNDWGIRLMNIDSTIMIGVMNALVDQGIPAIPVHDSVLLPARFEGKARAEMTRFWGQVAKGLNPCEIK